MKTKLLSFRNLNSSWEICTFIHNEYLSISVIHGELLGAQFFMGNIDIACYITSESHHLSIFKGEFLYWSLYQNSFSLSFCICYACFKVIKYFHFVFNLSYLRGICLHYSSNLWSFLSFSHLQFDIMVFLVNIIIEECI